MEYIVKSCVRREGDKIISVCGGWCCYHLDFRNFPDGEWFRSPCNYLEDGVCSCYDERPPACVGAPFYDGAPELYPPNKFPLPPWCCFRRPVLEHHHVPFQILDSGEECIAAYKRNGLNFTRWWERKFYQDYSVVFDKFNMRPDSDDDGYPD